MVYEQLLDLVREHGILQSVNGVLGWDQQVMMPPGELGRRSEQRSVIAGLSHDLATRDEIGDLLERIDEDALSDEQRAQVREIRREYERATAVPKELVEEIEATASRATEVWKEARSENDFSLFSDQLEQIIELRQEYARQIDADRDPYAVLFDGYEYGISLEKVNELFDDVKEGIAPLIREQGEAIDADPSVDVQRETVREIVEDIGYDFDKGRLDESEHPFTAGYGRITTRYEGWLSAITAAIHEAGHGMYEHGLPEDKFGTPLGEYRSMSVHESQSRLWENHVGRSRPFWQRWYPRIEERYGIDASFDTFMSMVQQVQPGLIRVEADEVTYTMHVVLRFELERQLVTDDISVDDLPRLWNEKMDEYLGVQPGTDAEGVLQDIHWSMAEIGYFPTYTLGSIIAAQLFAAAERDIDGLQEKIQEGNFAPLRDWLHENVWKHGRRYTTEELVRRATGNELGAEDYISHLRERYA